jgi:hypothetical protein
VPMPLDDSCYADVTGLSYLGQSAAVAPAVIVQGSSHQTATSALVARALLLFISGALQSQVLSSCCDYPYLYFDALYG